MTDATDAVTESVLPCGDTARAESLASVVVSGLAAGIWFRCPGVAGPACSAVMRARVVSTMPRGQRAATPTGCHPRRRLTRLARWRR